MFTEDEMATAFVIGAMAERYGMVGKVNLPDYNVTEERLNQLFSFCGQFEEWACKMTGQW